MAHVHEPPGEVSTGARVTRNWIITASLVVMAICAAGSVLMYLRDILTPLFIAVFLYFLIQPLVETLFNWKLPAWMLYALLVLIPLMVVLVGVWLVDANVRDFAGKLPEYQRRFGKMAHDVSRLTGMGERPTTPSQAKAASPPRAVPLDGLSELQLQAQGETQGSEATTEENEDAAPYAEGDSDFNRGLYAINEFFDFSRKSLVESALHVTLKVVEVSVLVVFYLLFLFIEARKFHGRVRSGFEKDTADRILGVVQTIDDSVRQYLWIKTGVSFGLGLTTWLLCWLFGLDFALLWGVLMFLANYITYVGSIAALAPPIAIAFVQFNHPIAAAILTALLVLNRLFWIDYAEIRFSGEHLDISPLLLLISIALLGWIWGVVGMLLAVPLVTSTKIVLSHFDNTRHIAKLMSDD